MSSESLESTQKEFKHPKPSTPQYPSDSSLPLEIPALVYPRSALARISLRTSILRGKSFSGLSDSGKSFPSHFVKHTNGITLLLSGQRGDILKPVYSNGDTIVGILAISRPTGLLSLEVKVILRWFN